MNLLLSVSGLEIYLLYACLYISMVILQSIYTETVPSKDPWNCLIFLLFLCHEGFELL